MSLNQLTDDQITEELEKAREQRFSLQKQLRETNIKLEKIRFEQNQRRRQKNKDELNKKRKRLNFLLENVNIVFFVFFIILIFFSILFFVNFLYLLLL